MNLFENLQLMNEAKELYEMATVGFDEKLKIRVTVHCERPGSPYFKVNMPIKLKPGETQVARLHYLDNGHEIHKDKFKPLKVTNDINDKLVEFFNQTNDMNKNYTNWQMACYQWNIEQHYMIKIDNYFNGDYDEKFKDNINYVPSDTRMPGNWSF